MFTSFDRSVDSYYCLFAQSLKYIAKKRALQCIQGLLDVLEFRKQFVSTMPERFRFRMHFPATTIILAMGTGTDSHELTTAVVQGFGIHSVRHPIALAPCVHKAHMLEDLEVL